MGKHTGWLSSHVGDWDPKSPSFTNCIKQLTSLAQIKQVAWLSIFWGLNDLLALQGHLHQHESRGSHLSWLSVINLTRQPGQLLPITINLWTLARILQSIHSLPVTNFLKMLFYETGSLKHYQPF